MSGGRGGNTTPGNSIKVARSGRAAGKIAAEQARQLKNKENSKSPKQKDNPFEGLDLSWAKKFKKTETPSEVRYNPGSAEFKPGGPYVPPTQAEIAAHNKAIEDARRDMNDPNLSNADRNRARRRHHGLQGHMVDIPENEAEKEEKENKKRSLRMKISDPYASKEEKAKAKKELDDMSGIRYF